MLTKLTIRNFKRFDDVAIELSSPVVFVGPNNSGKTTALQALALWELGLRRWIEKRVATGSKAKERRGVVINRRDLVQLPVPRSALLWRDLHLRQAAKGTGKATQNVLIEICVEGVSEGVAWSCPLEFDYSTDETIHCRPSRANGETELEKLVPPPARAVRVAYLPPMSGLAANERRIDEGAIQVSLGEGQTAQVLRNLCWKIWEAEKDKPNKGEWGSLVAQMERLFGAELLAPEYVAERGEIQMTYRERLARSPKRVELDLSASGRGFQQTLLVLTFLRWKPGSVVLIDEPDAHLEVLRQRQIYAELIETCRRFSSQLIVATHSEIVLNEATRDKIVAFVGKPHVMRQSDQVRKALALLGYEQFLQAETKGWVLYLEGSTDLEALRALAQAAGHPVQQRLADAFVHYVSNEARKAREHFFGLLEAYPHLRGVAIFDNTPDVSIQSHSQLREVKWTRRELENYFCQPFLLRRWVEQSTMADDLFGHSELQRRRQAMEKAITENTIPVALNDPNHSFWLTNKVSDEYLPAVFGAFFKTLGLPNAMNKSDYCQLARLLRPEEIADEIKQVLDLIQQTSDEASP
ncbi:MAG: AAA family ATPase [Verrucomicrobiales bacterium]|nr:AAA family ATPase [Verrucomicrobiales bacterium]